ncbi:uncharacterized protein IUM83_03416 [Phytophthora cinnamomi]|uniref:uncharacterized protein n=1 Tax=Phytophthora cinnamomi TaxID=4785 RepID=UPI003559EC38|nr:hypothetical protein IUM83_03416 [Phytophthora cinnamomi]
MNPLGFVTQPDYTGDSDVDLGQDEELNPALAEQHDVAKPDLQQDSSSSGSSDGRSDGSIGDDGDVDMKKKVPVVQSFAAQKQQALDRAENLKAKSQQ